MYEDLFGMSSLNKESINEGTMKNLWKDRKMIASNLSSKLLYTGNWEKVEEDYLKMIQEADDMDRIRYIRKDIYAGIHTLEKRIINTERALRGEIKNPTLVKQAKSGNTPEKMKKHVEWLKSTGRDALNKRAKELRKSFYESYHFVPLDDIQEIVHLTEDASESSVEEGDSKLI